METVSFKYSMMSFYSFFDGCTNQSSGKLLMMYQMLGDNYRFSFYDQNI